MVISLPYGFYTPNWTPDREGTHYKSVYSPLFKDIQKDMTILINLSHGGYIGHASTSTYLSGILSTKVHRYKNKNETLDQFVARHVTLSGY